MTDTSTNRSVTFQASIIRSLTKISEKLLDSAPDQTSNAGKLLSRAFLWDTIAKYAEKQSKLAWEQMEKEELVSYKGLQPGEYTLAESSSFYIFDKVSEPRRAFSPDVMVVQLKKYKVPAPIVKEMIEKSKVPGKSTHTVSVVER
jgi:hypothetical protein